MFSEEGFLQKLLRLHKKVKVEKTNFAQKYMYNFYAFSFEICLSSKMHNLYFLDPERLAKGIFRSHFFPSICPYVRPSANFAKFIFL